MAGLLCAAITLAACRGRTFVAQPEGCFGFGPWDSRRVTSSAPGCVFAEIPQAAPRAIGQTFFTLRGGALVEPVEVPLFVAAGEDPDGNCNDRDEWFFFQMAGGRIYIGEFNSGCGGSACRLLDPATRRFASPSGGCIPAGGVHWRARGIGEGWVEVRSDSEGIATLALARWTPETPFRAELEIDLSLSGSAQATPDGDGLLLSSPCDLAGRGCEFTVDYSSTPPRRWRWTKETGVVPSSG